MATGEAGSGIRWLFVLAAFLAAVIFVYPMTLDVPLLDPDEGLFAAVSQEMVERDEWIVPTILGEPFLDKPIFYFWAQILSLRLFGFHEAAVRLPGLMFGLLGAVTTAIVAWRMFGRTIGLVAGLFYGTMILPVALAQAAAHDVALIPLMNLALLLFWESDFARSRRTAEGYAVAIGMLLGLTVLTKGFVGIALVGVAYGCYLVVLRRLSVAACVRGAAALAIAAGIASLWYIAVEVRQPGYLYYFFVERHLLGFATDSQFHGGAPWWYYLPILLGGGLPWIAYLPVTIRDSWARRNRRKDDLPEQTKPNGAAKPNGAMVLLWCWLIACTLLLSLANSKLATYLWPVFPAVAILAAVGWGRLLDGVLSEDARRSLARTFLPSCIAGPIVPLAAILVAQAKFGVRFSWPVWVAVAVVSATALLPVIFWLRERFQAALSASISSIALQFTVIITVALPHLAANTSARDLAYYFNRQGEIPDQLLIAEEQTSSLVFYLDEDLRAGLRDGQIRRVDLEGLPKFEPGTVLSLPEHRIDRLRRRVDLSGVAYQTTGGHRLYDAGAVSRRVVLIAARDTALRR